ncbi:hypothetical protein ACIBTZ_33070 [Micromonospora sp. NPDC049460]|uniref:hypothetical protein n=1 Tax=Micromonospora sp. NPDC049460 TaxID=3364272 RepID=UPI00379D827B
MPDRSFEFSHGLRWCGWWQLAGRRLLADPLDDLVVGHDGIDSTCHRHQNQPRIRAHANYRQVLGLGYSDSRATACSISFAAVGFTRPVTRTSTVPSLLR